MSQPPQLGRLWAGWRGEYLESPESAGDGECVFCTLLASDEPGETTYVVWRGSHCAAVLNLFPYTSGHLMVMPVRHLSELEDVSAGEATELWQATTDATTAIKHAYTPDGINVGINLGRAAGAGIPGHVHVHCLPRWDGDTNFMTSVAEVRVLPESLDASWEKLRSTWPGAGG